MQTVVCEGHIDDEWLPSPPDPGLDLTKFLAWLKKHSSVWPLELCQRKWDQLGHRGEDIEQIIRKMARYDLVTLGTVTKKGKSIVCICVKDRPWADNWASYRNCELPHHGKEEKQSKEINKHIKR